MTANGWEQIGAFLLAVVLVTKPLGVFMSRIFERERTFLDALLRPVEKLVYRAAGIEETHEMGWGEYAGALLVFSVTSLVLLYGIERLQRWLPLNPQKIAGMAPDLAFNTAASFASNTNWQAYAGESAASYFTQMAGLAYHNFASAAAGIAVAMAVIRGIARRESGRLGNFWVDMTRGLLWLLLPLCFVAALFFVSQGVVQNLGPYTKAVILEPQRIDSGGKTEMVTEQEIAQGPVASQEAIKLLGTNGGGFFNANSAHPFENPTPLSNFAALVMIFAIPSGLTYTLGRMTGSQRHGWAVWRAMAVLFLAGVTVAYWAEARGNPLLEGVDQKARAGQAGGNMEGKEVRFGIANSALFATATTAASCGAVNSMHDSYTPLGGLVPLANILLGEVVFGGVGAGLYGMFVFIVLAVFIAGLMVGRTPEYLGKKIEAYEVKMAMLAVLIVALSILGFSALAAAEPYGTASIGNGGPHGLSEIVYAYSSAAGNNGSAFGGLNANTGWYNTSTGVAMILGRFFMIIPILAMAGNLAGKKTVPESAGTFPVSGGLFTALLVSTIVIIGALTFFPMLSLGPILEHLLMESGRVF